jgi:hypothetical protein
MLLTLLPIWYLEAIDRCLSPWAFIQSCAFSKLAFILAKVFCMREVNFFAAGAVVILCSKPIYGT